MSIELGKEIRELLLDPQATKVLTTTDNQGELHVLSDPTITLDDDGHIVYLELIEFSQSNSNLVTSIWFKRKVALYLAKGDAAYLVKGFPVNAVICGPLFTQYYRQTTARNPEYDLSTAWLIEPVEVSNESYAFRKQKEREDHPLITHLDRLAK